MTIRQLRFVLKAVQTGSYSEAAKQLFVSEPSISTGIRELETELGIRIFSKNGRGILLTSSGKEFLDQAQKIVAQTDFIEDYYAKGGKHSLPRFFVSSQHYPFAVEAFSRLLAEVDETRYVLGIRENETVSIFDEVASGNSDIGVIYMCKSTEKFIRHALKVRNILFTPLKHITPCVYISVNHPFATRPSVRLEEMREFAFVSFSQDEHAASWFAEEAIVVERPEKVIHISERGTVETVVSLNANTYAIGTGALVPTIRGKLTSVPIESQEKMLIGWIQPQKAELSDLAKRYLALLRESMEQYQTTGYF